jgi:hypothetical protein
MSDKTTVLRGFNTMFFEFLKEIETIFPENTDIKDAKVGLEFLKKGNPTSIIKAWHYFVYQPYKEQIAKGDITFFCEKDYQSDLVHISNPDEIMKAINRIRDPIKSMGEENKKVSLKYVANLCRLSDVYSKLG